MHMADALISPAVGGAFAAVSAATLGYSSWRVRLDLEERKVPLMGVLGAFVFAAQMVNFSIPGTGSSGHLGGGLLLAILLGPHAAFLAVASVLIVQALFFADGGLLALGCNVFNLGVFPCFLAYPLVFRPLAGDGSSRPRFVAASIIAALVGLEMGASGVVLETTLSGVSSMPPGLFLGLMLGIHLAIGIIEGFATAAVTGFVRESRPDLLDLAPAGAAPRLSVAGVLAAFLIAALVTGGLISYRASSAPDGLEWSIAKTGAEETAAPALGIAAGIAEFQGWFAPMPDYAWRDAKPGADPGTGAAGMIGGMIALLLALGLGFAAKRAAVPKARALAA